MSATSRAGSRAPASPSRWGRPGNAILEGLPSPDASSHFAARVDGSGIASVTWRLNGDPIVGTRFTGERCTARFCRWRPGAISWSRRSGSSAPATSPPRCFVGRSRPTSPVRDATADDLQTPGRPLPSRLGTSATRVTPFASSSRRRSTKSHDGARDTFAFTAHDVGFVFRPGRPTLD